MGFYGGLKAEDTRHWGEFTTFKSNAPALLERIHVGEAVIYCSPLVDPYQPVEADFRMMPRVLDAVLNNPPRVFTIQTRSPLILRDLSQLLELSRLTKLRVSMSVTTDLDAVRKRYEPHCEPNDARLEAITRMRECGIEVYATLAPLLPCNPEVLAELAVAAGRRDLIGDPLHVRDTKPFGATTRACAVAIARHAKEEAWFDPEFQHKVVERIRRTATSSGFRFETGPGGFAMLARLPSQAD